MSSKEKFSTDSDAHASRAKIFNKSVWGWILYDWANSVYATVVLAGFFPIFFKSFWNAGVDVNTSTARLGFCNSLAAFIIALLAPFWGAVADQFGVRKKTLLALAFQGALLTVALYWVPKGQWLLASVLYILGNLGFTGSVVFYDALLPFVTQPRNYAKISSWGYAFGYLGGGVLFALNVAMTLQPEYFGLANAAHAVRISFVTVGIWWAGFSIFTWLWVQEPGKTSESRLFLTALHAAMSNTISAFKTVRKNRVVFWFLIAYWLYIDGVNTIVHMSVDYGLSIGLSTNHLITALLITQFVGFPSALGFSRLSRYFPEKNCIMAAIVVYSAVTVWAMMMKSAAEFYVMAITIGLVQGGIQALSRSLFSKFVPQPQSAQYFGIYNLVGKFAAWLGPWLIAVTNLSVKKVLTIQNLVVFDNREIEQLASRAGIVSLFLLFGMGAFFLMRVRPGDKV